MSKFTVYTDKNSEFRWKFAANNDQVVAKSGRAFTSKEDCLKSLSLLQKDITGATVDPTVQARAPKSAAKGPNAAPSIKLK